MQQVFLTMDWMSIKLNGLAVFLAWITGDEIGFFLAGLASVTTICYNMYRWFKDLKNKK